MNRSSLTGLFAFTVLLAAPAPAAEILLPAPIGARFVFTTESGAMALSRDGTRIAFPAAATGKTMIWIRGVVSDTAQPIAGTEDGQFPFWSPDGRFVGFFADGKLKTVAATGGTAHTLCDAPLPRGGAWNAEDTIVFAPDGHHSLERIAATGGSPTPVTRLDEHDYSHRFPSFLPDGRHFLYLSQSTSGFGHGRIFVGSLDSTAGVPLISANAPAMVSSNGDLFFVRRRTLMVQRLDMKRFRLAGKAKRVAEDIQYFPNTAAAMFTVADNGTLAYHCGPGRMSRLIWVDRSGKELGSTSGTGNTQLPRISHAGDRIVYSRADPVTGEGDLFIVDVAHGRVKQFTFGPGDKLWAAWSADDTRIAYSCAHDGVYDIFVKQSNGSAPAVALYRSPSTKFVNDWSRDGRYIVFQQIDPHSKTGWDLWVLDAKTRKAVPLAQTRFNEEGAAFSADGKWIAFASNATGRNELYVQSFPSSGAADEITTTGGSEPQWSEDGSRIYFRDGSDALAQIDVATSPELHASQPLVLFPLRARWLDVGGRHWEVTADGKRILQDVLIPEEQPSPIVVRTDWTVQ